MSISASAAAALNVNGLPAPVSVADSSANVAAYLDALEPLAAAGKLASLTLTDTGTPALTIAAGQLTTDAQVLALIGNAAWSLTLTGPLTAAQAAAARGSLLMKLTAGLVVSDSAANVVASLPGLQSHASWIASITLTDVPPAITLTPAQLVANPNALLKIAGSYAISVSDAASAAQAVSMNATLLGKVSGGLTISDSAAGVAAAIDTLQARGAGIGAISLTGTNPVLTITAQQLVNDAATLQKIGGSYTISVSGSATAAQAASVRNALIVKVSPGLAVSDSAANVVANLAGLQAHAPWINAITLTDTTPVLALTATQLVGDAAVLMKIFGSYSISVSGTATAQQAAAVNATLAAKLSGGLVVSDSAASVSSSLDALEARASAIASITLTDATPVLSITAAQAVSDAAALLKIGGSYGITLTTAASAQQAAAMRASILGKLTGPLTIVDSAADVAANLAGLQAHAASISAILLTDDTPVLSITPQQLTVDATALLRISGSYSISLTAPATVAQVTGAYASLVSKLSAGFAVSDTAAAVSSGLDALQARAGAIASVSLTDTTPVLQISAQQLISDASVLQKVGGAYTIAVSTTATVQQAVSVRNALIVKVSPGLTIQDSAANVSAGIAGLQAHATWISAIVLTDATPVLTLTAEQMIADAAAVAKIVSPYTISVSGNVTAQQVATIPPADLAVLGAGLQVVDSAANIVANLATLEANAASIGAITLTDTPSNLVLTAAQLVANPDALALIGGTFGLSVTGTATVAQATSVPLPLLLHLSAGLAVSDLAGNVLATLDTLQGLGNAVASITITGTPSFLTVTAAQLLSDGAVLLKLSGSNVLAVSGTASAAQAAQANVTLLGKLTAGLAVADSATAVTANLDALAARAAGIGTITLNDPSPAIGITAATLAADSAALAKIAGSYALTVTSGTLTAAQLLLLPGVVTANLTGGLHLSDSVADITANLAALSAHIGTIAAVALTDATPQVTVTTAQLVANGLLLSKITGSYSLTVNGGALSVQQVLALPFGVTNHLTAGLSIADSAATLVANLPALETLSGSIASVSLFDTMPVLSLTAAQMIADAAVLLAISSGYQIAPSGTATVSQASAISPTLLANLSTGLAISDSSAAVTAGLGTLQSLGAAVGTIALSDGSPAVSLSAGTLAADAGTLAKITTAYVLTVSSGTLTAAQAVALPGNVVARLGSGLMISDTASGVGGNLDGLQALGAALGSISLTDPTPVLTISATQLVGDSGALLKIGGSYHITVSGTASVAQATAASATLLGKLTAGLAISDSAADVTGGLDTLQALGGAVASIALTDSNPAISVTASTLMADAGALAKVTGPYSLSVASGMLSAAQVLALPPAVISALTASLVISDSAADVVADLDALQGLNSHIASITLTDGGTPVLLMTAGTLVSDAGVLGKIGGNFSIAIMSGAVSAQQILVLDPTLLAHVPSGVAVSDTAADVAGSLAGLQALGSAVASIVLTDPTPVVTVTAAQLTGDAAVLLKIGGSYHITVSGTASVAQATAADSTLLSHLSAGLVISDTSDAVAAGLDALEARSAFLGPITLTDGSPVISLTAAQLVNDASVLLLIGSTYHLTLTGPASAQLAAAVNSTLAGYLTNAIAVSDSAANVTTYLDGLEGLGAELGSIALTDGGTPAISIGAATLVSDAAALGKISGPYTISITGDTVTAAQIIALGGSLLSHVTGGLALSDSAANVSANLAALQALGGGIASVSLTGSPATFAVTAEQLWHDAGILQTIITGGASLVSDPTNTSLVAAAAHLGGAPAYSGMLQFADTAADVVLYIDSLQALQSAGHLGTITLTDTGTPTLSLTAAQLVNDAAALGHIGGTYSIAITSGSLSVSQVLALSAPLLTHLAGALPLLDSSSTIAANLTALGPVSGALASVSFTDGTPPTISLAPAAMVAGLGVLNLASGYSISISGTFSAQQAAALAGTAAATHLLVGAAVNDTAAQISANLAGLEALATAGYLGPITLSDTNPLNVTPTQLLNDVAALRKITSSYTFSVSDPLTAQQATSVNSVLVSKLPSNLAVSDTPANIITYLDQLQTLAAQNHLGSITLTGGTTLAVTADELTSDANALAALTGTYQLQIVGGITAAQAASYAGHLAELAGTVNVQDSATNVVASLTGLQTLAAAHKLGLITFTDTGSPTLTLTGTQFAGSTDALLTILGSYSISLNGTMTAAQIEAVSMAGLLGKVSGSIGISDTGADVIANLGPLSALAGQIGSIAFNDSTTTIQITQDQLEHDAAALDKISGLGSITVGGSITAADFVNADTIVQPQLRNLWISDTSTAVLDNLDTLNGLATQIGTVTFSDNPATITITPLQLTSDTAILDDVTNLASITLSGTIDVHDVVHADASLLPKLAGLDIVDTDTAVLGDLDTLAAMATQIHSITLTNGVTVLAVSTAQLDTDAAALDKVSNLATITLTDNPSVSNFITADASAQGLLRNVSILDTSTAVLGNLDTLGTLATHIGTIAFNDGTTSISISTAQLDADAAALDKVAGLGTITLSDQPHVADVIGADATLQPKLANLSISDTGSHVLSNLDTLAAIANQIGTISLSDTTTLGISQAQLENDAAALDKVHGLTSLTVSGTVTVQDLIGADATVQPLLSGLTIADTASDVLTHLAALETLKAQIAGITLTDGTTPTITVNAATLGADADVLVKIGSAYNLHVSDILPSVTAALAVPGTLLPHLDTPLSVDATDTDLETNIDALESIVPSLGTIVLAGNPVITISGSQLVHDAGVLNIIDPTSYTLALAGGDSITATEFAGLPANVLQVLDSTGGLAIAGPASDIEVAGNLDALTINHAAIGTITVTDNNPLSMTAATLLSDWSEIQTIVNANSLPAGITVSNTLVASQIAGFAGDGQSLAGHLTAGVTISASAAEVLGDMADLITMRGLTTSQGQSELAAITLTGTSPTLAMAPSDLVADKAVLATIDNGYTLTIGSGTIDDADLLQLPGSVTAHLSSGLVVSDTSFNVQNDLDGLTALAGGVIGSITLSDASPAISISAATLENDEATLAKISTPYALSVSGTLTVAELEALPTSITNNLAGGIAISDTNANVEVNLGWLHTHNAEVGAITLTPGTDLHVTASSLITDLSTVLKVTNDQLFVDSGTFTASQVTTLYGDGLIPILYSTIDITDTTANLLSNLPALQDLATDGGYDDVGTVTTTTHPLALNVTASQASSDVQAINLILGAVQANPNAELFIQGTSGADNVDASQFAKITNVTLGQNAATLSFSGQAVTVNGSDNMITLGSAVSTVNYALGDGVEVINGFQFGTDLLDVTLGSGGPVTATDVTVGGVSAVLVQDATNHPTQGVVLVNPGIDGATLSTDHMFTAGDHVLIS